ncbi:MAG TPA: carboxypeptidase-like regulatory domain-containing protein [Kofleriaceae bacterium]|jgi:hypothetical protein
MQARWRIVGLFGWGVGLFACGGSTPAATETSPKITPPADAPPSGPPVIIGTVRDETGALVQGIQLVVGDGKLEPHIMGTGVSDEHGQFRFGVELGDAMLRVQYGLKSQTLLETFHAGDNPVDVTVESAAVAKWRANSQDVVCPSSKPGTILEGHTTTQKDIDELAHAILERGKDSIPDYGLAASGKGDITVIAEIGHNRRLSTNALPPGFAFGDEKAIQAQANLSRNQIGYIHMHDIWSDGTCATVMVGGDIAVPEDPNLVKMCCCTASSIYEKRGGTWVFVQNAWTMCS